MKSVFLWLSLSLLCVSCQSIVKPSTQVAAESDPLSAAKVRFVFEDIHPSVWHTPTDYSMFLNVFVFYQGRRLRDSDIKGLRLYDDSGFSWTKGPEVTYIGGWDRFETPEYSANRSVLSLGQYTLEITMAKGNTYRRTYDPTDPELLGANTKRYVYSAKYDGKKDQGYVECIRRAHVKEAFLQDEKLHVTFSIDDQRVENGTVAAYDKDREYIGEFLRFKNVYTHEVVQGLNHGTGLLVDGVNNQLTLTAADLHPDEGKSFSDIEYVIVVTEAGGDPTTIPVRDETIYIARTEMTALQRH